MSNIGHRLLKLLFAIYHIIYIPFVIMQKLAFVVGVIVPFIVIAIGLKDYYPEDYSILRCIKSHIEAGIITGGFIIKYLIAGAILGIVLFVFFFLIVRELKRIYAAFALRINGLYEMMQSYKMSAKDHAQYVKQKELSVKEEMQKFKEGPNYISAKTFYLQ